MTPVATTSPTRASSNTNIAWVYSCPYPGVGPRPRVCYDAPQRLHHDTTCGGKTWRRKKGMVHAEGSPAVFRPAHLPSLRACQIRPAEAQARAKIGSPKAPEAALPLRSHMMSDDIITAAINLAPQIRALRHELDETRHLPSSQACCCATSAI